ncbi:MAG: DMT family transporter [Pseudooceanicola sp.]|nr:DMT family transporter [Pseudooceanicola sp.]
MDTTRIDRPGAAIVFVLVAMLAISANDVMIKQLSGGYALHQVVFFRSAIGIVFGLALVHWEGGLARLRTRTPVLHAIRGLLVVISNMTYFAALAVLPLADVTALFFVAPLFITLLSIPFLGEKVGPLRLGAVVVGFAGVVIMQQPWAASETMGVSRWVMLLPVLAALCYAANQIMTRRLGLTTSASVLTVYIQATFIVVSLGFWLVAGDGRYAEHTDNGSLIFLLRAWVMPASSADLWLLIGLGLTSTVVGYCLSQAYRLASAATVAPFEYSELLLAVFWGWAFFATLPGLPVWIGMGLIVASGLFVFFREQVKARAIARGAGIRRR